MLEFYKIRDYTHKHLIIKDSDVDGYLISYGNRWEVFVRYFDESGSTRLYKVSEDILFEFETDMYMGNGLVYGDSHVIDLNNGKIIDVNKYNRDVTFKTGKYQLYEDEEYGDIFIIERDSWKGCNIRSNGYIRGYVDWSHIDWNMLDEITLNIPVFNNKIYICGESISKGCVIDLESKELICPETKKLTIRVIN